MAAAVVRAEKMISELKRKRDSGEGTCWKVQANRWSAP